MFKLDHLTLSIHRKRVLDELTIEIKRGSIFGLIGPDGAGKTTALRAAAGLLRPDSGDVLWEGRSLLADSKRRKSLIGYVPDIFGAYGNMRVSEYMEFFASASGLEGLQARKTGLELLDWVGLSGEEEEYVERLSGGRKKRLSLARAMLHEPRILLLDEPVIGLEPENRKYFSEILQRLKENEVTVLISSHILSDLSEACEEFGMLRDGRLLMQGQTEDMKRLMRLNNPLEISVRERAEEASALLRREASVKTIAREEKRLFLTVNGGEEEEARLLTLLVQAGIPVCSFVRRQGDLDSLFYTVMERKERVVSSNETESGYAKRDDE